MSHAFEPLPDLRVLPPLVCSPPLLGKGMNECDGTQIDCHVRIVALAACAAQLLRGHSRKGSFSRAGRPDLERVSEVSHSHSRQGSWSQRP